MHLARFYEEQDKKRDIVLPALGIFLISSAVLLLAIMGGSWIFGSDLIAQFSHYQISTFVLQQYSSAQILGYYIPSNQTFLLFLDDWFALLKIFLFSVGLLWVLGRILGEKLSLTKIFVVVAWSSIMFLPIAGVTMLFWGLRFIIPLYYNYVYFVVLGGVIGVVLPIYIVVGLGKLTTTSIYKRVLLIGGVIIIFYVLWTLNHADLLLGHIF